MNYNVENLGPPDIKLEGLQIWVHGRQFPNHDDYWDGNWLRITAHYGGNGSSVWASGPIIHLGEIAGWCSGTKQLLDKLQGESKLDCMEPNLSVTLKAKTLGHIAVEISITPDHMTQEHKYLAECDQTYLNPLIKQCEKVLQDYPIKGQLRFGFFEDFKGGPTVLFFGAKETLYAIQNVVSSLPERKSIELKNVNLFQALHSTEVTLSLTDKPHGEGMRYISKGKPVFKWSLSKDDIAGIVEKISVLLKSNGAGHQYLSDHFTRDDVQVMVSKGEYPDTMG